MKKFLMGVVVIVLLLVGAFYLFNAYIYNEKQAEESPAAAIIAEDGTLNIFEEVIGQSVEGRDITAYQFGGGDRELILIGGLHGGYEWNTGLLAFDLIDYLTEDPERVPEDLRLTVIPVANPDGHAKVIGKEGWFEKEDAPQFDYADEVELQDIVAQGRFNANDVDLNRNFECKWKEDAVWRDYGVGAGTEPFSEPESKALRDYILNANTAAVVVYHSASNGVYTSFCEGDPLPETVELLDAYSVASGYPRYDDFPFYEVTGDIADWLATQNVPAISVELRTHSDTEFDRNLKGINALTELLSQKEEE